MSCRFKLFILVLIVFTLVFSGCSASPGVPETTPTTEAPGTLATKPTTPVPTEPEAPPVQSVNGHELYSINGVLYPTVLGEPILGKAKVSEIYKPGAPRKLLSRSPILGMPCII